MKLISKTSVIRILNEEPSYSDVMNVLTDLEDKVNDLPTIEERKTGKWIWSDGDCRCSLCHISPLDYTEPCGLDGGSIMDCPMEFCPHCGAKMGKEQNE